MKSVQYYQKLPQIAQKTTEWYAKRAAILSATKIASLLHLNSYHTYHDLLEAEPQLKSEVPDEITAEMVNKGEISPLTWGTVLESVACQYLEKITHSPIGELGLRIHPEIPYLGASPDGIQMVPSQNKNGLMTLVPRLIEIKCPQKRMTTYRVPLEYWVQTQIGMEVWDIDQTLYSEFKFRLTTDHDEYLANQQKTGVGKLLDWGQLTDGVYWMLDRCWTYVIQRDHQWFRRIKCQIAHFYSLKFLTPVAPSIMTETDDDESFSDYLPIEKTGIMTRSQTKAQRTEKRSLDNLIGGKRKRIKSEKKNSPAKKVRRREKTRQESDDDIIPTVSNKASLHPHLLPVNRLSNYLREDPILDWLELHGPDAGFVRQKNMFLDYYNQLNLRFKLNTFREIRSICVQNGLTYRILNASLNNLMDIPEKDLLLKMQYDCHLIDETKQSMKLGLDVIMMGQLSVPVGKYTVWDTYDLLIRRDRFKDLFANEQASEALSELTNVVQNQDGHQGLKNFNYVPIKVKYTTLEFLKGGIYLRSKHQVDQMKMGAVTSGLILDRKGKFGLVPKHGDVGVIAAGIQWLKDVHLQTNWQGNAELGQSCIYPNMKNTYDSQWHSAKNKIAQECDELTQIAYMGTANRQILHEHGVTTISQLKEQQELLEELKSGPRIANYLSDELYLPPLGIDVREADAEVFLDFENVSSLAGPSVIFLTGMLVRRRDKSADRWGPLVFHSLLVDRLDKESEAKMLNRAMQLLNDLGRDVLVYHWSNAEPRMLRGAGFELPDNCDWVDLYDHFLKNGASLPNCYTYGLKDVAESLHQAGLIQSKWLHGLDGTQAMVLAWLAHLKCEQSGEKFCDDQDVLKICEYNYVDVKVLEEIRDLL